MPTLEQTASREPLPLYARGRQVGKATSTTWSPILKKVVSLASVDAGRSEHGTKLEFEWTVEGRRSRTPATVVELPFFSPPRKTATVADWRARRTVIGKRPAVFLLLAASR